MVKTAQEDSAWTLKNLPGHWRLWGSVRLYHGWFSCRLGESFRLDHRLRGHLSTACLLGGSWGVAAPGVWLCRAKQQPGERLCRVSNSQGLELPKNKRCFKHLWWCLCNPKGWCSEGNGSHPAIAMALRCWCCAVVSNRVGTCQFTVLLRSLGPVVTNIPVS